MTQPFTPSACDLRDFAFMPLDVRRLRDSSISTAENPEEFRAAVLLWCAAWHQVPAGSLPADDKELASLAGFGRFVAEWLKIKDGALRGFEACDDGRLYHRVVCEKALEAWGERLQFRKRSAAGNAKKASREFDPAPFDALIEENAGRLAALKGSPIAPKAAPQGDEGDPARTGERSNKEGDGALEGAQGTGTGDRGQGQKKSDDFFGAGQPAKASRRKPEVTVPDDFPDDRAKLEAREKARVDGKALDVDREAERFRDHAAANDRRARDWAAAWRMWISKALERAPPGRPPPPRDAGSSAAKIYHIGDREIAISADDPNATWKIRMVELTRNRSWKDLDWGARPVREAPQREGVQVPDEVLAEFGFPTSQSRSAA